MPKFVFELADGLYCYEYLGLYCYEYFLPDTYVVKKLEKSTYGVKLTNLLYGYG